MGRRNTLKPCLTLEQVKEVQQKTKEQILSLFLANSACIDYPQSFPNYTYIFSP